MFGWRCLLNGHFFLNPQAVIRSKETQRSRGYAFLVFRDPKVAEEAVARGEEGDGFVVDGRTICPKFSTPSVISRKIFVGGISQGTTEEGFKEHFAQFGAIAEGQVRVLPEFAQDPRSAPTRVPALTHGY